MDRTRADDDQQAVVRTVQDAVNLLSRAKHRVRCRRQHGKLAQQVRRRDQLPDPGDANVVRLRLRFGFRPVFYGHDILKYAAFTPRRATLRRLSTHNVRRGEPYRNKKPALMEAALPLTSDATLVAASHLIYAAHDERHLLRAAVAHSRWC